MYILTIMCLRIQGLSQSFGCTGILGEVDFQGLYSEFAPGEMLTVPVKHSVEPGLPK